MARTTILSDPRTPVLQAETDKKRAADDEPGDVTQKKQRLDSDTTNAKIKTSKVRDCKVSMNQMIEAALAQPGSEEWNVVKRHRNRLLKANLDPEDPRNAIVERNQAESLLLSLPAEIRIFIFGFAQGGHHIHILSEDPVVDKDGYLPAAKRVLNHALGPFAVVAELKKKKLWNVAYPSNWRPFYDTVPRAKPYHTWGGTNTTERQLVVKPSGQRLSLFAATCRQIYDETKFLPYSNNEFSFQDEMTMLSWFAHRVPEQLRTMNNLFLSIEIFYRNTSLFEGTFRPFYHCAVKKIRISRLANREVYDSNIQKWVLASWATGPNVHTYEKLFTARCRKMLYSREDYTDLEVEFID
ncbi:hypothetical protein BDV96DRAFT_569540 [Lophiotrema nucula]|uniref:Uncharacterized protein n=1 Tax=Lophiotrema nucula TaxID=690887 RepID=A0A6A5ZFJ1_9PLEO|nr:hypothetical protein BDV96DRAFT_569540 [Lophiotrema nucula]